MNEKDEGLKSTVKKYFGNYLTLADIIVVFIFVIGMSALFGYDYITSKKKTEVIADAKKKVKVVKEVKTPQPSD